MEETNMLADWFASQSWFGTASMIMAGATMVSMFISDKWADKYPVISQINSVLNFIAGNIFKNKNKEV